MPCCLGPKWREARPVVEINQHGPIWFRTGDIAAENDEAQTLSRGKRELLEPFLVAMLGVVIAEEAAVRDAIKLDHGPRDVLLHRHPRDATSGEGSQGLWNLMPVERYHVLGALRVHVAALEPDAPAVRAEPIELGVRARPHDGRARNRIAEDGHHVMPVTSQHTRRRIDDR